VRYCEAIVHGDSFELDYEKFFASEETER
jgi:hypothetical protein